MGLGVSSQTWGSVSNGAQVAGAASSVVGAFYGAKASHIQADIDETNARIAEQGAQAALLQGQREVQAVRLATANLKSSQRTALASNGVDLGSDSAVRALTTTDYLGEVDAATAEGNALRAAFGYRTQAVNMRGQAAARRAVNPWAAAGSTLLGTGAQVARSWYRASPSVNSDLSRTTRGSGD